MRAFLALLSCVLFSAAALAAEPYPTRPIRLIVPFPPAGITDLSGRLIAEALRAKFNQPVVIENKPGANGVIGLREMLKSEPDGYTLMVGTIGSTVIGYAIDSKPSFDPMRDMVPIAGVNEYATAMVVNNNLPVNNVQEFVAYAKAHPGKLSFGSTGVGALDFLAAELLMREAGIQMVHVPYKGGPLALNDLLGGNIEVIVEVFPVVMEQIKAKTIKGLAVTSPYRLSSIPDVPTFAEAGLPGVSLTGWLGIYGPPKMPEDIRQKLGAAITEIVKQPAIQAKLREIGFEPRGLDTNAFTELHNSEVKRWVAFLNEIGIKK